MYIELTVLDMRKLSLSKRLKRNLFLRITDTRAITILLLFSLRPRVIRENQLIDRCVFSASLRTRPVAVAVPDKCVADGRPRRSTRRARRRRTTWAAAADSAARGTRTASPAGSRHRRTWTETANSVSETDGKRVGR